ncbi:MAG: HlyD family secretion protein [Bacteriovoracaceae bacterium]|jgi:hypothetical protein|nr:HlyD family secretion protein [Bacteriovoracaceae bacterium]
MNKFLIIISIVLLSTSSFSKELIEKIRIYGVIKAKMISTSVALGSGLVHVLPSEIGNKVIPGTILLKVLERDSLRSYRSTISGFVAKVHITAGAAISPGMPLVTVVDPDKKFMEISLSPTDARKITKGIVVKTPVGKHMGIIDRISPIIDPDTGAVIANLELINNKYRIGEVIPIDLILGSKQCDEISTLSNVGGYGKDYLIKFVSDQDACLMKKK